MELESGQKKGWHMLGLFGHFPNPGSFDNLKAAAANILTLDNFEGARFEFNKTMTQKFALLHNVSLAAGQPGTYEFGAHVGDEKTLLASRIDMAGRLTGRINTQLGDSLGVRLQAQVSPEAQGQGNSFRADLDYKGGDFFAGGYFMGGGLVGASYLQSLSPKLAVGAEGFLHTGNRKIKGGSGAARYTWGSKGDNVLAMKAGSFGQGNMAEIAYSRKLSEKVSLATEMQYYHSQLCTFGLGYQFNLRTAVFKGHVASDTTCSAVLEEHIQPGINLILSGQLNHKRKDYKFGVGLNVGGA